MKPEIGPKCPRCQCEDTTRERNYGKPVKDGRWWCMKCGHLWFDESGQRTLYERIRALCCIKCVDILGKRPRGPSCACPCHSDNKPGQRSPRTRRR